MQFAISTAFHAPADLIELARAADECGYAYLAMSDHVVHPRELATPYPYTEDGQRRWEAFTPWPDPWVTAAALAMVTTRIRFYTSVYVLPLRNPFQIAKSVGTAAVLSGDRVSLGVGVGWCEEEFELMEQSFRRRGARANEMFDVLRKLWGGGWVEHHGEFYDFDALEMSPSPARPIPIYSGGFSKPALRRAAHHGDGWISDLHTTAEILPLIEEVLRLRAEGPRAGEPFEIFASVSDAHELDGYRRLRDAGATHLLTMPWFFYSGAAEDIGLRCDGVRRFADDVLAKL